MTTGRAKEIADQLLILNSERSARMQRGVPVPPALAKAIESLEAQLNNPLNRAEADNMDEARSLELEPLNLPWYTGPWGACLLVVVVLLVAFTVQSCT